MNQKILSLVPKNFLCPYCGKWHEYEWEHELGYYDSEENSAELDCFDLPICCYPGDYRVYFDEDYCYYSTEAMCDSGAPEIVGRILIASINLDSEEPVIIFEAPFTSKSDVGSYECRNCGYQDRCIYVDLGDEGDNHHMKITFGFEFDQSEYDEVLKEASSLNNREEKPEERKKAIDRREQVKEACEEVVDNKEGKHQQSYGDQMNPLLPLMLFKDKLGGDDDTMKLVLMSSMMGGNTAGSGNMVMSYLMLDTLMGKKYEKELQDGEDTVK